MPGRANKTLLLRLAEQPVREIVVGTHGTRSRLADNSAPSSRNSSWTARFPVSRFTFAIIRLSSRSN
jgi:hypothetical protein